MIPERGFPQIEFEKRLEKAQWLMSEKDLDVMFFCTEAEVRYFTGFLTQFWPVSYTHLPSPRDQRGSRLAG